MVGIALQRNEIHDGVAFLIFLDRHSLGHDLECLGDSLGPIGGTVNLEIELRNHTPIECARQQLTNLAP